jgi:hypothetical protein
MRLVIQLSYTLPYKYLHVFTLEAAAWYTVFAAALLPCITPGNVEVEGDYFIIAFLSL